jgi:predicted CXXCH cytochrome family protein
MERIGIDEALGGIMKKLTRGLVVAGLVLSSSSAVMAFTGNYVPGAGINGTVHDLGTAHNGMNFTASPADSLNRICIFCHSPHNTYRLSTAPGGSGPLAPPEFDYLPLWNHLLPTNTVYIPYENGPGAPQTGAKASQAILNGMTPGSTSLLCLSCHDGSVAVNQYGNSAQPTTSQSTGVTTIAGPYQIGKDKYLGNHHPIGFNYDDVQAADVEIRNADTVMLTPTTFVRDHLYTGGANMECGTCHSVHNKGNAGETLLWRSDQNSELCLTCHDKGIYTAP